jgi:hypothetical protein
MQGLVTLDWNKHTIGCDERYRQGCTDRLDAQSRHKPGMAGVHVTSMERVARTIEEQRLAKANRLLPKQLLVEKFGEEGAAHVELIQKQIEASGGYRPRRIRASKQDRLDVLQLSGDSDDQS